MENVVCLSGAELFSAGSCGRLKPAASAAEAVRLFAEDEVAWLDVFVPAWRHVMTNGQRAYLFNPRTCGSLPDTLPVPTTMAPSSNGGDAGEDGSNAATQGDSEEHSSSLPGAASSGDAHAAIIGGAVGGGIIGLIAVIFYYLT